MESLSFFAEYKSVFVILHVVGVVIGMGAALIADLLFGLYGKDKLLQKRERKTFSMLSTIVWIGLVMIVITGIGIFLSNPDVYVNSAKFLSKMTIVFVIAANGFVLLKLVQPHMSYRFLTAGKERNPRKIAFVCGAVSIVSWILAFILALLKVMPFSYGEIMSFYLCVLALAIAVAVMLQKKKFA